MSGKQYQAFMSPSAYRRYKKFDPPLQQKIKEKTKVLSEDPHRYDELMEPLKGIRSYHFKHKGIQ
ncbi:MAG: hypothetical protein J7K94_02275 [Dehalococcoidia bacterium]|nr:hypothetical protein [Dehalococcoidia bacterium]